MKLAGEKDRVKLDDGHASLEASCRVGSGVSLGCGLFPSCLALKSSFAVTSFSNLRPDFRVTAADMLEAVALSDRATI